MLMSGLIGFGTIANEWHGNMVFTINWFLL
jgi:hypothetical protein